jgi:probable F420-dependent oxidoreductase
MKVAITLPIGGLDVRGTLEEATAQIDAGYHGAWSGEVNGPDFATMLASIATRRDADIGVAVAPVQTRSTWLLAATAITLGELSGGRFSLGVGTSSEVIVERWSGQPFDQPLRRLAESVAALREIFASDRASYDGEFVSIDRYPRFTAPSAPIPIYVAALNARNLEQAGRIGDGLCLNQLAPHHVPEVLSHAHRGREQGELAGTPLQVMARVFCSVTSDVAGARARIRKEFAPYVATRVYGRFFRSLGFVEEVDAVQEAFARRDREASTAAMSDALVDTIACIGDRDHVAEQLAAYGEAGIDTIVVDPRGDDLEGVRASLEPGAALAREQ